MLKKIALLAMSMTALIAFAAPSSGSAEEWQTNGIPIGTFADPDEVHFAGTLSSTKDVMKISCIGTAKAELWNSGGTGVGMLNSLTFTPDPANTSGCTVSLFVGPPVTSYIDLLSCHVNATAQTLPWTILTNETEVKIEEVHYTNEFVGCGQIGIESGTKVTAEGVLTGTAEPSPGNCIAFKQAGDIPEIKIDGSLCATSGALEL